MTDTLGFHGQTALITGAARGIGLVIARMFAEAGARVVISDISADAGALEASKLCSAGCDVEFIRTDLSQPGAAAKLVHTAVSSTGRLDVLVNNARAGRRLGLLEETEENWDIATTVGLKAAFFAAQAAAKTMAANGGGAIVNVASVAAVLSTNESPAYHAAKAGLLQLTRYLAVAGGPFGIRANCVLPGLIVQDEHLPKYNDPANEEYRRTAELYQPMGRVGTADDVANSVRFLCSPASRYVSGACLVVDGAATAQEQFGMLLRQSRPNVP